MANTRGFTKQIAKVQTAKKLICCIDKLNLAPITNYAEVHAQGEEVNGRKVYSLIGIEIQDYTNGTGEKNVRVKFNLTPEYMQFLLTRVEHGWLEYDYNATKIYGEPDSQGLCTAQSIRISRHQQDANGTAIRRPWRITIDNGRGVRVKTATGGGYLKGGSYKSSGSAFITLTDEELYAMLKKVDTYIRVWEMSEGCALVTKGKEEYAKWISSIQDRDNRRYEADQGTVPEGYIPQDTYQQVQPDYGAVPNYPY